VLPRADPGDALPRTGGDIATAAGIGLLLVGGGVLVVRASRKGRHAG
jgi:LPXTG-motif cell wall-anchored protein